MFEPPFRGVAKQCDFVFQILASEGLDGYILIK